MDYSDVSAVGIIPARYASTRFPGKPLASINGVSMIERVYRQVSLTTKLKSVIVATDDQRILDHVKSFGGRVMMTSSSHLSGTDRIAEVISKLEANSEIYDLAVNIQGDEPFIHPSQIEKVIDIFQNSSAEIGTLIKQLNNNEDLFNPNVVKVVVDGHGKAMYFSRSPIPFVRNTISDQWMEDHVFYKHVGIYGYRTDTLKEIAALQIAPPEKSESLEQLRWMFNGYTIYTMVTEIETIGIDSPEDLSKLMNNPC